MSSRPIQLELFGLRAVLAPAPRPATPQTADPNTLRFQLLRHLNRLTGGRLRSLELTDNQRTILSVRSGRPSNRAPFELRIHHSFIEAPAEVLEAVAVFVESKRGSDRAREALVLIREHFSCPPHGGAEAAAGPAARGRGLRSARGPGGSERALLRGAPLGGDHLGEVQHRSRQLLPQPADLDAPARQLLL